MSLVTTKKMLRDAQKGGYAIGHFNTSNLEFTQAIIDVANELNSPVIVATSRSAIKYAGYKPMYAIVSTIAKQVKVPVSLHMDHGPSLDMIKQTVKHGWTSVMRDASALPFKDNVRKSKAAVTFCHKRKIPVEAELGRLEGEEGWVSSSESVFTDPLRAKEFVKLTGVDSLAVSIGTSHGAYKFAGTPKLDLKRLSEIDNLVSIPLVLHGASGVPRDLIRKANKLGAKIPTEAKGVPDSQIRAAVKRGICKVNTDTDLRIAFIEGVRSFTHKHPQDFDPRDVLGFVREELKKVIKKRMQVLGSEGKA